MTSSTGTGRASSGQCRVHNPDGKDFVFDGVKLGEIQHGETGLLEVYRTKGGQWVASQRDCALRIKPRFCRAGVFGTEEDLLQWLGTSKPAKQLAEQIGLSVIQTVD